MTNYCIAADFKKETIDAYFQLNKKYAGKAQITETYGQITSNSIITGGRVIKDLPKIDMDELAEYIEYSKNQRIGFNYSFNGACLNNKEFTKEGINDIVIFVKELSKIGVKSMTISAPSLMSIVQDTVPNMEIKVSIINQVNTVNKLQQYIRAGAQRVVLDETIVRNFSLLKDLAKEADVELIANSLCLHDCIYRLHHYNQTAHDSVAHNKDSIHTFYNHKCMLTRSFDAASMLKLCWIRPEDIKHYTKIGIKNFKLQGRHTAYFGDPVKAAECYMKGEFDGNLVDLLEFFNSPYHFKVNLDNKRLDGFIDFFINDNICKANCKACQHCIQFIVKNFSIESFNDMNSMAKRFYESNDELHDVLQNLKK